MSIKSLDFLVLFFWKYFNLILVGQLAIEFFTTNVVSDEKTVAWSDNYYWGYWKSDLHIFVDLRDKKFSDAIGKMEKRKSDF